MTAGTGDQVFGWGEFGGFNLQSGQTIRMGLSWPGDAGPVYLTAASLTVPSTLVRESSSRDLNPGTQDSYQTTEWITVTATSSSGWVKDIVLSYFATYKANNIIGGDHEVVAPGWLYHVIAIEGRVLAWLRVKPPLPGQPVPLIMPARDGHTLHRDIAIDGDSDDPAATADLLSGRLQPAVSRRRSRGRCCGRAVMSSPTFRQRADRRRAAAATTGPSASCRSGGIRSAGPLTVIDAIACWSASRMAAPTARASG
jgi:hypothetical protein